MNCSVTRAVSESERRGAQLMEIATRLPRTAAPLQRTLEALG